MRLDWGAIRTDVAASIVAKTIAGVTVGLVLAAAGWVTGVIPSMLHSLQMSNPGTPQGNSAEKSGGGTLAKEPRIGLNSPNSQGAVSGSQDRQTSNGSKERPPVASPSAVGADPRQNTGPVTSSEANEPPRLGQAGAGHQRTDLIHRGILGPSGEPVAARSAFAILVWDSRGGRDSVLSDGMAQVFRDRGVTVSDIFREGFLAGGSADRVLNSDPELVATLGLKDLCDFIILGKKSVDTKQDAGVHGLVTARGTLIVKVISTNSGQPVKTASISEVGGGFSTEAAIEQLNEKLLTAANSAVRSMARATDR